jgi:integrase
MVNRSLARLSVAILRQVQSGNHPPAYLHDGGGLYLKVMETGASWFFRYTWNSRPTKLGLGPLRDVSATVARQRAAAAREALALNRDPKVEQRQLQVAAIAGNITFQKFALQFLDEVIDPANLAPNTKRAWRSSLRDHVYPVIGDLTLGEIDREKVLLVLRPIWPTKNVTAKQVRIRIEAIMDEASIRNLVIGTNPARWLDLQRGLGAAYQPKTPPKPHPAMPWQEVPAFYLRLRAHSGYAASALRLAILAATRTQESLGARFDEMKPGEHGRLLGGIWTVPAERMKGKPGKRVPHAIPISDAIADLIGEMAVLRRNDFLFPHRFRRDRCLSRSSITILLTNLGVRGQFTVHGFRSTFKDWVSDNGFDDRAGERSLAHKVTGVKGHYDRTKMLVMRQDLMQRWADFVTGRAVMAKPSAGPHLHLVGGTAA